MKFAEIYPIKLQEKISDHMNSFRDSYFEFFEKLYKLLKKSKDKTLVYGDADFYFTLIEDKKNLRVFHVKNICTCSDQNQWIVIHDTNKLEEKLHIRIIYDDKESDYPSKNYPEKVNLKFWQDREFVCEYVEKFHMTKLGSIYGDVRDKGYVITYIRSDVPELDKLYAMNNRYGTHYFLYPWKHFSDMISSIALELK